MLEDLLRRTEGLAAWMDRHTRGTIRPSRTYVGKTYSGGSFPTAAGRVYLTHPMTVSATESEGSTPTFTVDASASVPVLVLDGPLAMNDFVVAKLIGGLWVAQKGQGTGGGGGGSGSFSGCSCTSAPTPLYLHVSVEGGDNGQFNSATLSYGSFPCVSVSFPSGFKAYVSTTSFVDPIFGDSFYYYIRCLGSAYYLSVVYPTSVFGSCYNYDIYLWSVSVSPNTCSPFSLTSGSNQISGTTTASITESP